METMVKPQASLENKEIIFIFFLNRGKGKLGGAVIIKEHIGGKSSKCIGFLLARL